MIGDGDPLMRGALPQIGGAHEMWRVTRQKDVTVAENVPIGGVRSAVSVRLSSRTLEPSTRGKQKRLHAVDQQLKTGQTARAVIE